MEMSFRDAVTAIHGMGFGALLLLGFSGAFVALYVTSGAKGAWTPSRRERVLLGGYVSVMAAIAWAAVLMGAYVIYPWYRAKPPAGAADLAAYPQRYLMSNPAMSGWHDLGMEWKEHIAWLAPIGLTAAAFIIWRYGERLRELKGLRNAALALLVLAFAAAGVAGFFGAMLNKFAPVRGGADLVLMKEHAPG
jgi:phosphoglycerol transferase MdoB-like AlkP superfamily enzyme